MSHGVRSGDLGDQRKKSLVICTNTPTPAIRKFMAQVFTNIKLPMRGCLVLLEYKIVRMSSEALRAKIKQGIGDAPLNNLR